jgi:hypothetical protein
VFDRDVFLGRIAQLEQSRGDRGPRPLRQLQW